MVSPPRAPSGVFKVNSSITFQIFYSDEKTSDLVRKKVCKTWHGTAQRPHAGRRKNLLHTICHKSGLIVSHRHFLELEAEDDSTTARLAAHQGRKTISGIALRAIGAQVQPSLIDVDWIYVWIRLLGLLL